MAFLTPDPRHLDGGTERAARAGADMGGTARFSRWDGSQDVADLTADDIVDALADDLLERGDLGGALRDLVKRGRPADGPGGGDLRGLHDLLEQLRRRRDAVLRAGRLADPLADVRQELKAVIDTERAGVQRRLAAGADPEDAADDQDAEALANLSREIAARRMDRLDALPQDLGGRIRELQEYDFLEPDARSRFQDLLDGLRSAVLDRLREGLSEAVRGAGPEEMAAQRAMVQDLNRLLGDRLAGHEPSPEDVAQFLGEHGEAFPGAATLDDVINQLDRRMRALQSLVRSLPGDQRAELQGAIEALLRDDRLQWDLTQLQANLDRLVPGGLGSPVPFAGTEAFGLEAALEQLERLAALEALESALDGIESVTDLGRIDRAEVRDLLGDGAVRDLDALDDLARRLAEAGYLEQRGDRLELTARGSRRIGQRVLRDLFARLRSDAFGGHRGPVSGTGGEREEASRPYVFGDPFQLDLQGTLASALRREAVSGDRPIGAGRRTIGLRPEDFAVYRTEQTTSAATVLLVDMSRSMLLRGCYLAAKRVAIALDTLIRTQYPRDRLAIVGFAYYARELRPEALPALTWHGYEYGTNLQHGLQLARRILARARTVNREVVVITDGEPTAHFEGGEVEFAYPPTPRTIRETLREVARCTREGITINTFMLDRSRALTDFVAQVTELNHGRAFYAEPDRLGEYVLVDFVQRRGTRNAG